MEKRKDYNFTWNSFNGHLKEMLQDLYLDESSKDVTLVCHDQVMVKAHRFILKACSPVFKETLDQMMEPLSIELSDHHHLEVQSILRFMYFGETEIPESRLDEFIGISKIIQLKGLEEFFQTNLFVDPSQELERGEELKERDIKQENGHKPVPKQTLFNCNQCDFETEEIALIEHHIFVNHRKMVYQCEFCNYKATQKTHLKTHVRALHLGFKHACGQCNFQGNRPDTLKNHILTKHLGIKYTCQYCQRVFSDRSPLSRHMKQAHKIVFSKDQLNKKEEEREITTINGYLKSFASLYQQSNQVI